MNSKTFMGLMLFYMVVSNILFPFIFYSLGKSVASAGNGFVVGSLVTISLWLLFGKNL